MKKLIAILVTGLFILFSLYFLFRPTYLDNLSMKELSFNELPNNISKKYNEITRDDWFSDFHEIEVVSLDPKYKITHEHTGMEDGFITLIFRGFYHHFYINNQHFKLKANKGEPFILDDKKLYYSKNLNMTKQDINESIFIQIDLSNDLD